MNKPKNVLIQCLSTLLIPTGLYAFKRINKLQKGILIYLSSYGLVFLGGFLQASSSFSWGLDVLSASLFSFACYLFSIVLPMVMIVNYTKEYNKSIQEIHSWKPNLISYLAFRFMYFNMNRASRTKTSSTFANSFFWTNITWVHLDWIFIVGYLIITILS